MDVEVLLNIFKGSYSPETCAEAETQLGQLKTAPGFCPLLLQLLSKQDLEVHVKQAIAIYLRNMITISWKKILYQSVQDDFVISENDKEAIREVIVERACQSEVAICRQLVMCIQKILKVDYPNRWITFVQKTTRFLRSKEPLHWHNSLLCLQELLKKYEKTNRGNLIAPMKLLLPTLYNILNEVKNSSTQQALMVEKEVTKNFYIFITTSLLLDVINYDNLPRWIEILIEIIEKPEPENLSHLENDDRELSPFWLSKEYAIRTMCVFSAQYGTPGLVAQPYSRMSSWFLSKFSKNIIEAMLKTLNVYHEERYVPSDILRLALDYLVTATKNSFSFFYIKKFLLIIVDSVIFRVLCLNDMLEEMFVEDPREYLVLKSIEYINVLPCESAKRLLIKICKKEPQIFLKCWETCVNMLGNCENFLPKQIDGALHMLSTLFEVIRKDNNHIPLLANTVTHSVIPHLNNTHAIIRSRACYAITKFFSMKIKQEKLVKDTLTMLVDILIKDENLPVKFEAAMGLQKIFSETSNYDSYLIENMQTVTMELLQLSMKVDLDEPLKIMQDLIRTYPNLLLPISEQMMDCLVTNFERVLSEFDDEMRVTQPGVIVTSIDDILRICLLNKDITARLQPKAIKVIALIFNAKDVEFFEEAFDLLQIMTCRYIFSELWNYYRDIYQVVHITGYEYFIEAMQVFHNFVTVDTNAFLSKSDHLMVIFDMCQCILTQKELSNSIGAYAAKLLEVTALEYQGRINEAIPSFVQIAFPKVFQTDEPSCVRLMCLQVLIATFFTNPELFFHAVEQQAKSDESNMSNFALFVQVWLNEIDSFVGMHDRKVCVIGLCKLFDMELENIEVMSSTIPLTFAAILRVFRVLHHTTKEADDSITFENPESSEKLSEEQSGSETDCNKENRDENDVMSDLDRYDTILERAESNFDEYLAFKESTDKLLKSACADLIQLYTSADEEDKKLIAEIISTAEKKISLSSTPKSRCC